MTPEEKAVLDTLRVSMQREAEHQECRRAAAKVEGACSAAHERKQRAQSDFIIAKQALRKSEQ